MVLFWRWFFWREEEGAVGPVQGCLFGEKEMALGCIGEEEVAELVFQGVLLREMKVEGVPGLQGCLLKRRGEVG